MKKSKNIIIANPRPNLFSKNVVHIPELNYNEGEGIKGVVGDEELTLEPKPTIFREQDPYCYDLAGIETPVEDAEFEVIGDDNWKRGTWPINVNYDFNYDFNKDSKTGVSFFCQKPNYIARCSVQCEDCEQQERNLVGSNELKNLNIENKEDCEFLPLKKSVVEEWICLHPDGLKCEDQCSECERRESIIPPFCQEFRDGGERCKKQCAECAAMDTFVGTGELESEEDYLKGFEQRLMFPAFVNEKLSFLCGRYSAGLQRSKCWGQCDECKFESDRIAITQRERIKEVEKKTDEALLKTSEAAKEATKAVRNLIDACKTKSDNEQLKELLERAGKGLLYEGLLKFPREIKFHKSEEPVEEDWDCVNEKEGRAKCLNQCGICEDEQRAAEQFFRAAKDS